MIWIGTVVPYNLFLLEKKSMNTPVLLIRIGSEFIWGQRTWIRIQEGKSDTQKMYAYMYLTAGCSLWDLDAMEGLEEIYVNFYTKRIIMVGIIYSSELLDCFAITNLDLDKVFININPQICSFLTKLPLRKILVANLLISNETSF